MPLLATGNYEACAFRLTFSGDFIVLFTSYSHFSCNYIGLLYYVITKDMQIS